MVKLVVGSQVKESLREYVGPIVWTLERGVIDPICWVFSRPRHIGGHRGVEGPEILSRKKIRRVKSAKEKSEEEGEW